MLSSFHRLLQLLLATCATCAVWCSAVHGFALPSTARVAIAPHHGAVLKQCIERVAVDIDVECELDEAPPTQQRFHAPDLLGLDDQPEDEDLGSAPAELTVYGPRGVEHPAWDDRLSPVRDPHTQLDRPPRA